jgi:hypothetical protein
MPSLPIWAQALLGVFSAVASICGIIVSVYKGRKWLKERTGRRAARRGVSEGADNAHELAVRVAREPGPAPP